MNLDNAQVSDFNKDHPDAFASLFKLYYPSLCDFATRFLDNIEDARDVVSELFEKLWTKQTDLHSYNNIKSVLYASVRNTCIDFLEKKSRDSDRYKATLQLLNSDEDYYEAVLINETIEQIYEEFAVLPAQCKKVFELLYVEGLTYKEAAQVLDLSEQTVRNQKTIGLKLLKRKIFPESVFTMAVVATAAATLIAMILLFLLMNGYTGF